MSPAFDRVPILNDGFLGGGMGQGPPEGGTLAGSGRLRQEGESWGNQESEKRHGSGGS